jgi:hypothetical protein
MMKLMLWVVYILLAGCSVSEFDSGEQQVVINYEQNQHVPSEQGKKDLQVVIDTHPKSFFTIYQPYHGYQLAELDDALWHTRALKLAQLARIQGLKPNQLTIKECQTCQNISISYSRS